MLQALAIGSAGGQLCHGCRRKDVTEPHGRVSTVKFLFAQPAPAASWRAATLGHTFGRTNIIKLVQYILIISNSEFASTTLMYIV